MRRQGEVVNAKILQKMTLIINSFLSSKKGKFIRVLNNSGEVIYMVFMHGIQKGPTIFTELVTQNFLSPGKALSLIGKHLNI